MNNSIQKPAAGKSRRSFLKSAGFGTAAIAGIPALAGACTGYAGKMKNGLADCFNNGSIILFQGDSITDAGREKKQELPNNGQSFGWGYANIIASEILQDLPGHELSIYNRGISANKVYQLAERWQKDCLDLEPDVLSILIGVNDYWHYRLGRYEGTPETYENDYRKLLDRTKKEIPGIRLVLCEPFILAGTNAVDESWLEPFSGYQSIAASLAKEFEAVWVPFQDAFNDALSIAPPEYWTDDGVHPSMAGAQLMAETWLQSLCRSS
jgi:lysophospholipase L1-like esterase